MKQTLQLIALLAACATPAAAQTPPRVELAAGYQVQQMASLFLEKGWFADAAIRVTPRLSVVVEAAGAYDDDTDTVDAFVFRAEMRRSLRTHSGAGGVRVSFRPDSRTAVYLQALGGAARVRTDISIRTTSTGVLPGFPGVPSLPGLPGFPDVTSLFPDTSSTTGRTHALVRAGGGVTFAATDRLGFRLGLDYGGLIGDGSPPGGPRLMGGLAFGF